MSLFDKKSSWQKEWEVLIKKEDKFLKSRIEKKDSFLNQKLAEKVPEKLQSTLDTVFAKAFYTVFEKGTGVIEKTYRREEMEKTYQINQFANEVRQNRKSLKAFSKQAGSVGNKNILMSGVSGIGMGVFGIGIPDIPVFTGMMLKNIYEISLSYGYPYDTEEEQYFILKLIEGSVSYGNKMREIDRELNEYMEDQCWSTDSMKEMQIKRTAGALSKELLYMKFLQGIPVVGAVGGAYDVIYMQQINAYAKLKYQKRFLLGQRK
jgi:hypothetical protein